MTDQQRFHTIAALVNSHIYTPNMQRMSFADSSIDIIIHSDTLEHVPDSKTALKESKRVLKLGGHLF